MSSVVLDDASTSDLFPPLTPVWSKGIPSRDDGDDPVIAAARAAGHRAGKRLAKTPLTPRQRAVIASLVGGGRA